MRQGREKTERTERTERAATTQAEGTRTWEWGAREACGNHLQATGVGLVCHRLLKKVSEGALATAPPQRGPPRAPRSNVEATPQLRTQLAADGGSHGLRGVKTVHDVWCG